MGSRSHKTKCKQGVDFDKQMKIVVDAHMLGEQEGGNETYIAGLLQGFASIFPREGMSITAVYSPDYVGSQVRELGLSSLRFSSTSNFRRLVREIPAICKNLQADLLHATYNVSPLLQCPYVITVHDVIFRLFPEYFSPRVRILLSTLMPISMWRAKAVITVSETSKQDILRFYPFVRHKIFVTPLAAGPLVATHPNAAAIQKYSNGGDFILAVGNVQPRKNLVRLVEAYILLRQRQVTQAKLVIVGRSQWQGSEIQRIATNSSYSQDIIFTGYLEDSSVAALLMACSLFVYPSLYEGFGLPVLEAMTLGAPVITSNISSLPEIAGEAALLIDPTSIADLADAITHVLTNSELRHELRRRGLSQAAQLTWVKTARATLDIYQWALQEH
jgi:glycosyltransferase involved in cell wall biosynthesis